MGFPGKDSLCGIATMSQTGRDSFHFRRHEITPQNDPNQLNSDWYRLVKSGRLNIPRQFDDTRNQLQSLVRGCVSTESCRPTIATCALFALSPRCLAAAHTSSLFDSRPPRLAAHGQVRDQWSRVGEPRPHRSRSAPPACAGMSRLPATSVCGSSSAEELRCSVAV